MIFLRVKRKREMILYHLIKFQLIKFAFSYPNWVRNGFSLCINIICCYFMRRQAGRDKSFNYNKNEIILCIISLPIIGAPGVTQTHGLNLRGVALYSTELQAHL